jgi:hypothetical protein
MPPVKVPNETKAELCQTKALTNHVTSQSIAETCAQTGSQTKCTQTFITGDFLAAHEFEVLEVHQAHERAEVA